jgi:hypothetical protein
VLALGSSAAKELSNLIQFCLIQPLKNGKKDLTIHKNISVQNKISHNQVISTKLMILKIHHTKFKESRMHKNSLLTKLIEIF